MVTPCTQIKTITALETNHINMNKTLDKIIDRLEDMITKDEFIKLENSINLFLDKADNKYADKEKCLELRKAFLWAM
jgi:heme oxygenase